MSVSPRLRSALLLSLFSLLIVLHGSMAHAKSPTSASVSLSPAQKGRITAAYGRLPLAFEQNAGQTDKCVKFLSRGPGYSLFLTPTQAVMSLHKNKDSASSVLRMTLKGANPAPAVAGTHKLPGQVNYLIGKDKVKWRTHIATYEQVAYKNVYRGVDLRYYGSNRQLEYDFIVNPGASADSITLGFAGAKSVALTKAGGLTLNTKDGGAVQWHAPVCYQTVNGKRQSVPGRFVVQNNAARFVVGKYDRSKPLVIDPALEYSTYLGGSNNEGNLFGNTGFGIAVDSEGSAYVTGQTFSTNFPTTTSLNAGSNGNVFVTKLNQTGTGIVYSTLIGGNGDSAGNGVTVDSSGYANVIGSTNASDFPVTDGSTYGGDGDAFIAQIYPDGAGLYYSKYVLPNGESTASGYDSANAVAIDGSDYIYVAALTYYNSGYPAITYVAKYDDDGVYQGSNYLYGSSGGTTQPYGIAIDADSFVYITGQTDDASLYTANNSYHGDTDAFVAELDPSLNNYYLTYLGGSGVDSGLNIAADSDGNAYVAGYSYSSDFPLTRGSALQGNDDAFVTKLNGDGSAYLYSTFISSTANYDAAYGIVVDSSNQAYVTGFSNDDGTTNAAFVTQLDSGGGVLNTQSLTGSGEQTGEAITLDATGNAYIYGITNSTNFTTTPGTYSRANSGGYDAFVTKVDYVYPVPSITAINPGTAFAGNAGFTLVVNGQGFVNGVSVAYFGSTPLTTNYVSPSELDAQVPASAVSTAGTRTVTVVNPAPGGGTSNGVPFAVTGSISLTVSPTAVYQGAPSIGEVTIPQAVSSDTTVTLSSSNTGYITVPASVVIPAGQMSASFQIASNRYITVDGTSTITASALGTSASAVSTVLVKYNISGTVTKAGGGGLGGVTMTAAGAGTFLITSYVRPAKTIPAGGTLVLPTTAFTVSGSIVNSVVALDITHPNLSQLAITLIAPDGRSVLLHATGSGGQNLLTAYPALSTPAQSLSTFNGRQINGTWKLQIQNTGSSTGTVNLFDVTFTYQGTLVETAVTASDGTYQIQQTKPATFAVTPTPTLAGYNFSPTSRSVTVGPDATGVNFTAGTTPTLTSVSPSSGYAGDASKTITLTGTNFVNGSVAYFNSTALTTTFVSATQLTAALPANLLTATGTASITVKNPAPGGTSGAVGFTILPRLKTLSLSPTSVSGGTIVTGTLTLTGAAPISGTTISLSSSNTGAATVPASVTVPGGATSATFKVTTKSVTNTTSVTITATGAGATKTTTLSIKPVTLSDLELSTAVTAGGTNVTATVTLSGPAPSGGTKVTPSSSNTAVATVPSSVTVAAGSTTATFTVTTKAVTANTSVVIGAALGTVTKSKTLTVTPPAAVVTVQSLSLSPTSVKGGSANSTGTVTLTAPAPSGGLAVSLSSSNTAAATVASTLNIAAGVTTVNFKVTTYAVTSNKTVTITASANGAGKSATLTVTNGTAAPVTVQSLSVSPTSVKGGSANSTGTVTLTAPAPSGGLAVSLSSSNTAAATVASTLNIAAGATTVKFKITTYVVSSTKTVTITAAANGASKSATLTVTH